MSNSNLVVSFKHISKNDLAIVGGKGANLGEMITSGFPVPDGFCVSTIAYKMFIDDNKLEQAIFDTVANTDDKNISKIGNTIRSMIVNAEMPKEISQEVSRLLKTFGENDYYAVRSSATAEDLPFASFAGQQDTYLNIRQLENILNSIKSCWASLYTDRAILYRIQNDIPHADVLMSVAVQKMILPDISGIMFTADPISGDRNMVSIDASFGIGEALVSGIVSPDIYKYNKRLNKASDTIVSEKKIAIVGIEGGGTKQIQLSEEESKSRALSEEFVVKLAELGAKVENHYGCPQDIEWCIAKNKIYIVQSRAITSLFPLPAPEPMDTQLHAYFSFSHGQVMTDPISPMGISALQTILPFNKQANSAQDCRVMLSAGGRIYADINVLMQIKHVRKIFPKALKNIDLLIGEALDTLVQRADFLKRLKSDKKTLFRLIKFMFPVIKKAVYNLKFANTEGAVERIDTAIKHKIERAKQEIYGADAGIERLNALKPTLSFGPDIGDILPTIFPAVISFKQLEHLEEELLGEKKYSGLIYKGLVGNITTEMGLVMSDIADCIRQSEELKAQFENSDYASLIERINALKGYDEFVGLFHDFINKYGMRCGAEIDIANKRWQENPEPLAKSIMSIIKTSECGSARKEFNETVEAAKQASDDFIKEVADKYGKSKAKKARRIVNVFRNMMPCREHPKYLIMNYLMIMKDVIKSEAGNLVKKGLLNCVDDVFYINFWELCDAVQNSKDVKELVEQRKQDYKHYKKLTPPRVMTSDGEIITATYKRDNLPQGSMPGIAASSGIIEGIAKVVLNPTDSYIDKGEILVAPFTDPGWTPLFINASGLVMEIGGLLTHGTVVAREYGIPAVVGVTDCTKQIKSGQRIRVDGNSGYVLVLED